MKWMLFIYPAVMVAVLAWAVWRIKRDDKEFSIRWRAVSFMRRYQLIKRLTRDSP